jgi:hypothetical protein
MSEKKNLFKMLLKKMKVLFVSITGSVLLNSSSVKDAKSTSTDYEFALKKEGKKVFESPIEDMNTEFVLELEDKKEDQKIIIKIHIQIEKILKIKPSTSQGSARKIRTSQKLGSSGNMSELEVKRQGRLLNTFIEDLKKKNQLLPSPIEKAFPEILKEEPEILVLEKLTPKTQEKNGLPSEVQEGNPILNSESELKKE